MTAATVTNTFATGTTILASKANQNFNDLLNYLNVTGVTTYQAGSVNSAALATGLAQKTTDLVRKHVAMGSPLKAINFDPALLSLGIGITDNVMYFMPIYLPDAATITGVKWFQDTQGNYTADQENRVGLYTTDGTTMTLVASCANDGTLWSTVAAQAVGTKAFSTPYVASAGLYIIGLLYNSSAVVAAPKLAGYSSAYGAHSFTSPVTYQGQKAATNTLPATQLHSGLSTNVNTYMFGLY